MAKTKEEIRKILEKRIQEDPFASQSFKALKQSIAHLDSHQGAVVAAVGSIFFFHFAATKQLTILLAEDGWFSALDTTHGMEKELHRFVIAGKTSKVDFFLIQLYKRKLNSVKEKITSTFPSRKTIIEQAFSAHNKKLYSLSIPVFLAQADGISKEMTGGEFFRKNKSNGRPRTAKFVESEILNPIYSQLFELLRVPLPISANEGQRRKRPTIFNRHAILHGEEINYGTLINSFKAISLLSYLSSLSQILEPAKKPMEVIHQLLKIGQGN